MFSRVVRSVRDLSRICLIGLFVIAPLATAAVPRTLPSALASLNQSLLQVQARASVRGDLPVDMVAELQRATVSLRSIVGDSRVKPLDEYRLLVAAFSSELAAIAVEQDATKATNSLTRLTKDITEFNDVASKALHAFPTERTYKVLVTVETVRSGVEVKGFEIKANPRCCRQQKVSWFPFSALSSPTSRDLPPGYYVISATKNKKITEREVAIGLDGQIEDTVQIDVAADE